MEAEWKKERRNNTMDVRGWTQEILDLEDEGPHRGR